MTPAQLIDTASRWQVFLEGFKTGKANQFKLVFNEINVAVRDTLDELQVENLNEISRTKLEETLSALEAAQFALFDKEVDRLLKELPDLAAYAAEFEAKAIKSVLKKKHRGRVKTPTARKAWAAASKRPVQATGELLRPMVEEWERRAIRNVNNAIRIGYDQGKTVPQILKAIQGTKPLRFKDGITAVNKRHATTVIHTGVQHVAATAREVTYEENPDVIKGIEWVSTLDGKTTIQCQSLDGMKFPVNEGPRPPIHPNCRSTTAPDMDDAFDFLDAGATRSSKDGYVDATETYYTWLKRQDEQFQDAVLGKTRGVLFRNGGLTADRFAALQLDKNFDPITLEEMRKLEPLAFQRAGLSEDTDD